MPKVWRTIVITALVACAAGMLGVYGGLSLLAPRQTHGSLDAAVHRELNLDAAQERRLEEIEARYAARKEALEQEMRAATRAIAAAVAEDKAYTPRVEQAVDRFHETMGELQHETILHVFEMRAALTPAQQTQFDDIVRDELLSSSEEAD